MFLQLQKAQSLPDNSKIPKNAKSGTNPLRLRVPYKPKRLRIYCKFIEKAPHPKIWVHCSNSASRFLLFHWHFCVYILPGTDYESPEARLLKFICLSIHYLECLPNEKLNLLILGHPFLLHIKKFRICWVSEIFYII